MISQRINGFTVVVLQSLCLALSLYLLARFDNLGAPLASLAALVGLAIAWLSPLTLRHFVNGLADLAGADRPSGSYQDLLLPVRLVGIKVRIAVLRVRQALRVPGA